MTIRFNHTIVHSVDREAEARFFTDVFGLPSARPFGHFLVADLADDASMDFVQSSETADDQHYAFLVAEDEFSEILARLVDAGIEFFADPGARRPGEINHHDGGRGVYFRSPSGHYLEAITRPYGSGG